MDHQSPVEDRVDHDAPTKGIARGVGELGADVLQLGELQMQLAREEMAVALRELARPTICIGTFVAVALASLPVLLVAMGELMVQNSSLPRGWCYLIVALTGVTISTGVLLAGVVMFKRVSAFQRSREELVKNLLWLKKIWKKSTRRFSASEAGCAEPRRPAHS